MQLFELDTIIIHKSKIENHILQRPKTCICTQLHYTYIAKQIKQCKIMLLTELSGIPQGSIASSAYKNMSF